MSTKPVVWVVLAFSLACGLASSAAAADGPYYLWGWSGPWTYVRPSAYVDQQPPYFAVHPPVYYSYPVSRTYGLLPYPYLPRPSTREATPPQPVVVLNPYVAQPDQDSTGPEVIINPFVADSDDAETLPEARLPGRVQVSYPAAMFDQPG
jgi:hypothetical protein